MRALSTACVLTLLISANVAFGDQAVSGRAPRDTGVVAADGGNTTHDTELQEVVVTGVFLGTAKQDASIAISTISEDAIDKLVPLNNVDLLRDVPGFFVDTSYGEIRSMVITRGVGGSAANAGVGYYYVSLQEDGLPVLNINGTNFGPDFYIRSDITLQRVEALRGGTASVTGPNAPGGIFNYLSKTGKSSPGGEVSLRTGLEGDGRNPFYRGDAFYGGSIGDRTYYSIGGFYRWSEGARSPDGYPSNDGGQVKANLLREYDAGGGGSVMLYGKYLSDHNNYTEFFPTQDFDNPRLAPGIRNTDEFSLPSVQFDYPTAGAAGSARFNSADAVHSTAEVLGIRWTHDTAGGWQFSNNLKHSENESLWNSSAIVFPAGLDTVIPYALINQVGATGTYRFFNVNTGQLVAQVQTNTGISDFAVSNNSLPGQQIQANGVFLQPAYFNDYRSREWINQLSATKRLLNDALTLSLGGYYAHTNFAYDTVAAGVGLGTLQHHPEMLGITLTRPNGEVLQITNPQGFAILGGGFSLNSARETFDDYATFLGANWKINDHFTLDMGVRYEYLKVDAANMVGARNPNAANPTFGGVDGDPRTVYDNRFFVRTAPNEFSRNLNTFSRTAALTWRINDSNTTYFRYALGEKAPDLSVFASLNTPLLVNNTRITPQDIRSLEVGYTFAGERVDFSLTPFLTKLKGIPQQGGFLDRTTGTTYTTPTLYNSTRTYGAELEGNLYISDTLDVHVSLTVQDAVADNWRLWVSGGTGPSSDRIQDFSGGPADNIPDAISSTTLNYEPLENLSTFVTWRYTGKRPSGVGNTWTLPGFHTVDVGATWNVTPAFTVNANINNVTDEFGVLSWYPPNAVALGLSRDAFTPALRAANPNAIYNTTANQPRAYFVTMGYKF